MNRRALWSVAPFLLLLTARSAHAAIAVDVVASGDRSPAASTVSTAAFSTAAPNELLLAFVASDAALGTTVTVNSVSGAGLTWTLVVRTNAELGTAEIWRAFAPTPLANVTVTATLSQSVTSSLTVVSFTGVDISGVNGSGAIGAIGSRSAPSGAPTASLVTTRDGSWVFGVGDDWDSPIARAPGAGQSLVHQNFSSTGDTYWVQKQNAPTPATGTTVTIDDTAPTSDRYNLSIVEILSAGATTPATWSLGGTISPAADASGATVALSGSASASAPVDLNGNYTFTALADGTYTVTPVKAGFVFTPASQSVIINGANATGINFSVQAQTAAPTVSITSPLNGDTATGTISVTAAASDAIGVSGVQFRLDDANLGVEVLTAPYAVSWDTATVADGTHTLTAVARNTSGLTTTSAPVTVTVSNGLAATGQWSAPFDLGIVAVNAVLLHTGKVLMFSGSYVSSWIERVWDPHTGAITLVPNPNSNLFCSGNAQLPDGRILVVGGFDSNSLGAPNANIFDPVTETWVAAPNMAFRRWYPTATTLPDGRMLVTSGGQTCLTCIADLPEIFDPATGRFSTMTTARLAVPYYPFMFVLPDGTVLDAGSNEQPVATSRLNLTSGSWSTVDPNVKDGHSAVMYKPGKILKSGTAADSGTLGLAASTAFVLDTTQPSPVWRQVASMANPRAFHNTTLLPDGTVLVTGGGTTLDGNDTTKAVFAAELWSPATETWRTLASASVPRLYHSTALLLPDARVLSAGGGNDSGAVNQTRGQIFSPPYLFKGPRPTIASAPDLISYGGTFSVQTPDAASIASVSLIRPGAVTHAFDEDQRLLSLTFTAGSGALTITAPANANLAPPGYYMLFLVNSNGVPSVAAFVRLPAGAADTVPPTPPGGLSAQGALGSATLSWTPSADDTGVAVYNVYRSTVSGFTPSASTRIGQSTATTYIDTGVAAGTYFYLVTAQDVAGNVSDPSNEAVAFVLGDTTAPTVSITSPAPQDTVTGSIVVSATATDDVGVVGVQFAIDGAPLGAEIISAPYSMTWNTATTSNGPHTIAAVARDAAGNTSESAIAVSVSNVAPSQPGLVAAYGFNERIGVLTFDASGQANTGTLSGATWTANGRFGSALSFNGTDAWLTIADAPSLDLTTGMTVEAWVNPSSDTGTRTVALKETAGGFAYALYSAVTGQRPVGYVHTRKDLSAPGSSAVPLNTWTHLAMTFNGTSLRLYVNGALVRTQNTNDSAIISSPGALRIGGNAVFGEYFRGIIDEVRIYNRALAPSEIQIDMNTPIQ
jgi:hypothetical protein